MRKLIAALFLLVTLTLGVVGASIGIFALTPTDPGASVKVIIEVRKGQTPGEIIKILSNQGTVSDSYRMMWVGRLTRQWKRIKAGEYEVSAAMSPLEIFGVLTSGVSVAHPVTVREGENMYEIAADLEIKKLTSKSRVLALCSDRKFLLSLGFKAPLPRSLEGFLFPDTYFFNRAMNAEDMLKAMVRKFQSVWSPQDDSKATELGMTQLQVVTLASIIEKETGAPEERPLISSVFHNRIRKKIRLQSDPTTIYGMWETYRGKIHRSDLLAVNLFNTYTLPGLPVGPISNPGKEALKAALNPSESQYIFFVSHNDGTHEFTTNLHDHNHAVAKFQLDPKARAGKSWRDLKRNSASKSNPTTVNY
ncbi:endolytic transglycosylase MltG [Bdellovibrionota bacterium FG-1]